MIEIPESNSLSKQITKTLKGKKIKNAKAASSPHKFAWFAGDPAKYNDMLKGKTVGRAQAYGGIAEISMDNNIKLCFQDGVNVRYFEAGEKLPAKHQLHIEFDDGSSLVCGVQMYGAMYAFQDGAFDNKYYKIAKTAPQVLSKDFNKSYFRALYDKTPKNLTAKAFLATEQRIPGLGNGTLQDILYNAKVNPKSKLEKLPAKYEDIIFDSVKKTLAEMTEKGGRDVEKDLFGNNGGYITKLSKNTAGLKCGCGSATVKETFLGGVIYYCPGCQPLLK